jgi:hypothetical protein
VDNIESTNARTGSEPKLGLDEHRAEVLNGSDRHASYLLALASVPPSMVAGSVAATPPVQDRVVVVAAFDGRHKFDTIWCT